MMYKVMKREARENMFITKHVLLKNPVSLTEGQKKQRKDPLAMNEMP